MKEYIKQKNLTPGNMFSVSGIAVVVKDELNYEMNLSDLTDLLENFPDYLKSGIDYIIFMKSETMGRRGVAAVYSDDIIYVASDQTNNQNVLDDIVHEIGHHVETRYGDYLYGDGVLEKEFLQKRKLLSKEFEKEGYKIRDDIMMNSNYSELLDSFFHEKIGYPKMTPIVQGIFYSPYGATSLNEYFANGFEAFFYHKDLYLKKVSPKLFEKLENLKMEKRNEF